MILYSFYLSEIEFDVVSQNHLIYGFSLVRGLKIILLIFLVAIIVLISLVKSHLLSFDINWHSSFSSMLFSWHSRVKLSFSLSSA